MGFFDSLKNFGSKIISGIRKGWDWIKRGGADMIRKVWGVAKPVADTIIPGSKPITDTIGRVGGWVADKLGV